MHAQLSDTRSTRRGVRDARTTRSAATGDVYWRNEGNLERKSGGVHICTNLGIPVFPITSDCCMKMRPPAAFPYSCAAPGKLLFLKAH